MKLVTLVFVLCSSVALAAPKHAPLPDAIYEAKTVFLVNQTGYQSTVDGAFDAFTKGGKLSVVSDKSKADLIITFTYADEQVNGTTTWGAFNMSVQLRGSDETIFQSSYESRGFHLPSNRGGVAAKDLINQFMKRLAEPH